MPRCSAATEADQAAYVHYKSVIGYLLGMNEDLLPRSKAAAKALSTAVASYQFGPHTGGEGTDRRAHRAAQPYSLREHLRPRTGAFHSLLFGKAVGGVDRDRRQSASALYRIAASVDRV